VKDTQGSNDFKEAGKTQSTAAEQQFEIKEPDNALAQSEEPKYIQPSDYWRDGLAIDEMPGLWEIEEVEGAKQANDTTILRGTGDKEAKEVETKLAEQQHREKRESDDNTGVKAKENKESRGEPADKGQTTDKGEGKAAAPVEGGDELLPRAPSPPTSGRSKPPGTRPSGSSRKGQGLWEDVAEVD
jgi:hypothetical protein